MEKIKVVIGDWSGDGHDYYDEIVFKVNKDISTLRQGYKDSCKKTGVQFNINEDYTGLGKDAAHICTEYIDCLVPKYVRDILKEFDIYPEKGPLEPDYFAELILEFIRLSVPDLEWEESSFKRSELKNITPLNGWWNAELNVQFGYGLYGD